MLVSEGNCNLMHDVVGNGQLIASLSDSDQLRAILATSPAAMIVIDEQGTIQGFGKAAEAMFGYSEVDMIGENVSKLMAEPHRSRHDGYLQHYVETGERRIMEATRVENACDSQGHIFPVEISVGEAWADDTRYFVGFLRDVGQVEQSRREMQRLLEELAHISRVSAMGALATSIAHELNQPLTSIANYAEGVRDMLAREKIGGEANAELVEILDSCSKQAVRAGKLLHRLRDFVKGGETRREPVDISVLLDDAIKLSLINGFRRNVKIDLKLEPDLPKLYVDPLQAQQVLFNLIRNAFEAMHAEESGGHCVRICAKQVEGGMVEFSVADSGTGIDPDIRETLFENFVTTKGGGMGVGLAICRQIVEAYGGKITADSHGELGGAIVTFTLPVMNHDTPEAEAG